MVSLGVLLEFFQSFVLVFQPKVTQRHPTSCDAAKTKMIQSWSTSSRTTLGNQGTLCDLFTTPDHLWTNLVLTTGQTYYLLVDVFSTP